MAKTPAKPITSANVAHITPSVLSWAIARSSHSREHLAKRLRVSVDELQKWEKNTPPPMEKAEDLATLLGIPFGYFFLAAPPDATLPIPDRRRLTHDYKPTQHFLELLNHVLIRRDWYRDYLLDSDAPRLPFVGQFANTVDAARVAADIRRVLQLGPELRHSVFSWADYASALARRAEEKRILVMRSGVVANEAHKRVSRAEVQGFAIADPLAPIVFVNSSDFKSAQVFTIAHELAHIWIGDSAISNPNQGDSPDVHRIERLCDQIATEALVPEAEFRPLWKVKSLRAQVNRVDELAMTYWVSALVIIRRANELNLISVDEAQLLRKKAIAAQKTKAKKGRPSYYQLATVRSGHRLADAIRAEVESGNLVHSHASRLLGMTSYSFARFMGSSNTP
jgi:Zn-dependent peptidase ImmA (M78 family)